MLAAGCKPTDSSQGGETLKGLKYTLSEDGSSYSVSMGNSTDAEQNAKFLKSTYCNYYWKR